MEERIRVLRGVVYKLNSMGPRTEPWGTPQERGKRDDLIFDALTEKVREDR